MHDSVRPESANSSARSIHRRQLLRAGAWAAPAVIVASAVPAASASGETVPAGYLKAESYYLGVAIWPTSVGPLRWGGGRIGLTSNDYNNGFISYQVTLRGPNGPLPAVIPLTSAPITNSGHRVRGARRRGWAPGCRGLHLDRPCLRRADHHRCHCGIDVHRLQRVTGRRFRALDVHGVAASAPARDYGQHETGGWRRRVSSAREPIGQVFEPRPFLDF